MQVSVAILGQDEGQGIIGIIVKVNQGRSTGIMIVQTHHACIVQEGSGRSRKLTGQIVREECLQVLGTICGRQAD